MACYHPLTGYQYPKDGKQTTQIFFKRLAPSMRELKLPCGQCIGCRLDRSRMWAIRCVHESKMHSENSFITLTYSDENLPPDMSLQPKHFTNFMKRLRKKVGKVRYFHAAEYGEETLRPHHHACIFGFDFPDKKYFTERDGVITYTSDLLERVWGHGFCTVGNVNYESAAYVARYCMKKVNGNLKERVNEETGLKHYERVHAFTGEITEVHQEYSTMSRRPGIGGDFIDRYMDDVYPWDSVVINGHEQRPPRYYDNKFEIADPDGMQAIKDKREQQMRDNRANNTPARLAVREQVKKAQISFLKRGH